jgi:hypothetical protein
MGSNKRCK